MGKMNELSQILDDMVEAGNGMIEAANALREYFSSSSDETTIEKAKDEQSIAPISDKAEQQSASPAQEEQKALTKEDVRKILVAKSNLDDGAYKPQVKALVRKYSESGNLSTVKPEKYKALVAELEVIGNA